jgi:hypothetical protein
VGLAQAVLGQGEADAGNAAVPHAAVQNAVIAAVPQQAVGVGGAQGAAQVLPQLVANLSAAVNQGVVPKKGKNPEKIKCNRCGIPGHIAYDCAENLCDFCERAGHANADCPLHTATKPQLIMHGVADDELCFFEMPCTGSYKPKMENSRTARISVWREEFFRLSIL